MAHVFVNERASGTTYPFQWQARRKIRQRSFATTRPAERFPDTVENALSDCGTSVSLSGTPSPWFSE